MRLHLLELDRGQLAGFVQNVLGHSQLPEVVQQRGLFDRVDLQLVGDTELPRQRHRVPLHPADVTTGHLILGVDRQRQGLDRRQIELTHLLQMAVGFLDPGRRQLGRGIGQDEQRHKHADRGEGEVVDVEHQQDDKAKAGKIIEPPCSGADSAGTATD